MDRPASASNARGPAHDGAADGPSRARSGKQADARRATWIGRMCALGASPDASASVPSDAPAVMRVDADGGGSVARVARALLGSQRGEHCRFARPIRLRVMCEVCGVMAAHEDSYTTCGHGELLGF